LRLRDFAVKNKNMKRKRISQKEEGIISLIQSPEKSEDKTIGKNKVSAKKQANNLKDKGIISVIQTPVEYQEREKIGN
jgi:hypothetical protein